MSRTPHRRGLLGRVILSVAVGAASLGIAASASASSGKTLTLAVESDPVSLDPALQNVDPSDDWFIQLAYDPLIRLTPSGRLEPDLATSWKFTNKNSTKLELTIRKGVKFSDGTALTAADVATSLNYLIKSGVNGGPWLGKTTTAKATGKYTVLVHSKTPNSELPQLLTQRTYLGSVMNAKGLANPTLMKSGTYGAGPYVLDASATTPNSTYTYVPNPNYWNKANIHWAKIVINVESSTATALQAVQSGQANMMIGDVPTDQSAKSAGLNVENAMLGLFGVAYYDRTGSSPMANVKVREALSYAINRPAITKAIWSTLGEPGNDLTLKGFPGYSDAVSNSYEYNPAKAKKLLKEAGYPHGFSFKIQTTTFSGANTFAQTLVQDWAQIGVKAKLTINPNTAQLISDTLAGKYDAGIYAYGALPPGVQAKSFFNGGANQYNPGNSQDTDLNKWLNQAAASSSASTQDKLYAEVLNRAMTKLVWFSNVAYTPYGVIYGKGLTGTNFGPQLSSPDVAWLVAPSS